MTALALDVRFDGFDAPIGVLIRHDSAALSFAYTSAYLRLPGAIPISLSLPLSDEPIGDVLTRAFFDNLLQERDGPLEETMAREGIARDDIAGLLQHLGKDCAGALSILPEGSPPVKVPGDFSTDYDPIPDAELLGIFSSLHERRRLPDGLQDPSPLAGVQSKIALTRLPDGRLALPKGDSGAPTTHILKVPEQGSNRDARREDEALKMSRLLGFETAESIVISAGGIEGLLVKRFDRALDQRGRVVRIHQEDFAQALGLPASLKYERRGNPGRRFDTAAIRQVIAQTSDPALARLTFIHATLFDLLIGNADAHAKNHALLFSGGRSPRLAPRYDVLPTRLDHLLTDELPFSVGNAKRSGEITRDDLNQYLGELGIVAKGAQARLLASTGRVLAAPMAEFFEPLHKAGHKDFADLIAANMRHLLPELGVEVPPAAQDRDAFVSRGGGWSAS